MFFNKKAQSQDDWAMILNPVKSEVEKAEVVEKLIEIFPFSMEEASQLVDRTPIVIFDKLTEDLSEEVESFFKRQNIEVVLSNDAKVKRGCFRIDWPTPPSFDFLREKEPETLSPEDAVEALQEEKLDDEVVTEQEAPGLGEIETRERMIEEEATEAPAETPKTEGERDSLDYISELYNELDQKGKEPEAEEPIPAPEIKEEEPEVAPDEKSEIAEEISPVEEASPEEEKESTEEAPMENELENLYEKLESTPAAPKEEETPTPPTPVFDLTDADSEESLEEILPDSSIEETPKKEEEANSDETSSTEATEEPPAISKEPPSQEINVPTGTPLGDILDSKDTEEEEDSGLMSPSNSSLESTEETESATETQPEETDLQEESPEIQGVYKELQSTLGSEVDATEIDEEATESLPSEEEAASVSSFDEEDPSQKIIDLINQVEKLTDENRVLGHEKNREKAELDKRLIELNQVYERLKQENEVLQSEASQRDELLQVKQKEFSNLENEKEELLKKASQLTEKMNQLLDLNKELEQHRDEAKKSAEELLKNKKEFNEVLTNKERELEEVGNKLNEKLHEAENLKNTNESLAEEVDRLQDQVRTFALEREKQELIQKRAQFQMQLKDGEEQLDNIKENQQLFIHEIEEKRKVLEELLEKQKKLEENLTETKQKEQHVLEMLTKKEKNKSPSQNNDSI